MQSVEKESPSQQTTRSEFSRSMGVGDKAASDQPSAELESENPRVPGIGAASGVACPARLAVPAGIGTIRPLTLATCTEGFADEELAIWHTGFMDHREGEAPAEPRSPLGVLAGYRLNGSLALSGLSCRFRFPSLFHGHDSGRSARCHR